MKEYPVWEKSEKLLCDNLRFNRDYEYNKKTYEWDSKWIAKEKDPCPKCNSKTCHNYKKPYNNQKKLFIEKRKNND